MPSDPTARYRTLPSPLLIGHRGLRDRAPENTLRAIEQAHRLGVTGVEIDLRLSRDGEVMVFHDRDLSRMAGQPEDVASLTRKQLQAVDLGGERMPALDDVLSLCRELGLMLNVELKRDLPQRRRLVRAVARKLRRAGPEPLVVASSFDPAMIAQLRREAANVPVAVIYAERHRWVRRLAGPLGAVALHPDHRVVRALDLRQAHAAGRRVMCWTVNDPAEARRLVDMGVDGIMTDDPAALAPLFDERAR